MWDEEFILPHYGAILKWQFVKENQFLLAQWQHWDFLVWHYELNTAEEQKYSHIHNEQY